MTGLLLDRNVCFITLRWYVQMKPYLPGTVNLRLKTSPTAPEEELKSDGFTPFG